MTPTTLNGLLPEAAAGLEFGKAIAKPQADFSEALAKAASAVVEPQEMAKEAVAQFTRGTDGELHQTMMAVERADITLKFFVSVRNRCIEAYREVMRMGG